jgi:hypothetical protein
VKVLDVRDPQFQDIADEQTRRLVRRTLMREKLNQYVVDLRKKKLNVEVYQDRLNALFRNEAAQIAELQKKAQHPDSRTTQREAEFMELLRQP